MKKLLALCLSAAMLLGVFSCFGFSATALTPQETTLKTIAYVPLDDRPVDTDRVIYQAEACGFKLLMPDADLYQTHLDNQPTNSNGTQYGDRTGLLNWLKSVEGQCDAYALSMDQLLSGGLVNSRWMANTDLTLENSIIDYLIYLGDHDHKVYLFDTVMRLASTAGYQGYELAKYYSTRSYGMVLRRTLTGSDLTMNNIFAGYRYDASGNTIAATGMTDAEVDHYLASRQRKLRLIDTMLTYGNRDNTYYYIGVDDSNPAKNIQYNEIQYIRAKLGANGTLLSATDDLGMMLIAKIMSDMYTGMNARVYYYGGQENYAADDYDIGTLRSNMEGHLNSLNINILGAGGTADLTFLVLTKPTVVADYSSYVDSLMMQLKYNLTNHIPTVVLDASTTTYYGELQRRLLQEVEISQLISYSNWNTAGNTIGISVAQGVSRYLYLKNSPVITGASHIAFLKAMAFAYVKDISYKIARNNDASWFLQTAMNTAAFPNKSAWYQGNYYAQMVADGFTASQVNQNLAYMMNVDDEENRLYGVSLIKANMEAGSIITDLRTYATREVGTVNISNYSFPWYRDFEIRFDVAATLGNTVTVSDGSGYLLNERNSLITGVAIGTTASAFKSCFFGADSFTVTNAAGSALSGSAKVGTGSLLDAAFGSSHVRYAAVILGDVDGNGTSNSSDARTALVAALDDESSLAAAQKAAADVDLDGVVTSTDARGILTNTIV